MASGERVICYYQVLNVWRVTVLEGGVPGGGREYFLGLKYLLELPADQ